MAIFKNLKEKVIASAGIQPWIDKKEKTLKI